MTSIVIIPYKNNETLRSEFSRIDAILSNYGLTRLNSIRNNEHHYIQVRGDTSKISETYKVIKDDNNISLY